MLTKMSVCRIVAAMSLIFVSAYSDDVTVKTKAGTFVGFSEEIDIDGSNFEISKFLGIPYAEPPVGDLRFRKSVPKEPVSEPMEVKELRSTCMQVMLLPNGTKGSEDCLFLNVFTPTTLPADEKLAVMIWIHGGGFVLGSANAYIPDNLVANGPVIVVTINYRLSVWGFLSTGDSYSPGNYGLWDQHLAIKWVHDNIDAFGGDPNKVTIFGESAGSAAVIYQGMYKGNGGLFQRIIGQSGSASCAWANARSPISDTNEFASLAGCDTTDTASMMSCLRNLPSDVINSTINNPTNGLVYRQMLFVPSVDHIFVEESPADILNTDTKVGAISRATLGSFDLMTGANSGEGYLAMPTPPWDTEAMNNFYPNRTYFQETLVPQFLHVFLGEASEAILEAVIAEYTDWNDPENPETIREKYLTIPGDVYFVEPMCRTVDLHAKFSERQSSYMYYFTLKPSRSALPTPSWADKPNHGDDINFVFGGKGDLTEFGITEVPAQEEWEKEASTKIMTMWTNFAKTGNPNKPRDLGYDWLPYTQKHRHYFDIAKTMSPQNVKTRLDDRMVNFWGKIIPAIRNGCSGTSSSTKEGTCSKDNDCTP